TISYNAIVVLDSANCVLEKDEPPVAEYLRYDNGKLAEQFGGAYDETDPEINNQTIASVITIGNPNLSNLTIRFIERQPSTPLPQRGGTISTRWEVLNSGISPVPDGYEIAVFMSENESYDVYDQIVNVNLVPYVATRSVPGNSNQMVDILVSLPY